MLRRLSLHIPVLVCTRMVLASGVMVSCVDPQAVDVANLPCPCASGWICNTASNLCQRNPASGDDAGALADASTNADGSTTDGSAADTGTADAAAVSTFWFEGEAASGIDTPFQTQNDLGASSGMFVGAPAGTMPATDNNPMGAHASFTFNAPTAATYRVWGRVLAPVFTEDSFWVRMDGGTWTLWNDIQAASAWTWVRLFDSNNSQAVVTYNLTAGSHTLDFAYREPASLDKIAITTDPALTPTGLGN